MSVDLLQEQVELHLEDEEGSFKLIPGQEVLSKIDGSTVRVEWVIFKEILFSEKQEKLSNEETYKYLLQD